MCLLHFPNTSMPPTFCPTCLMLPPMFVVSLRPFSSVALIHSVQSKSTPCTVCGAVDHMIAIHSHLCKPVSDPVCASGLVNAVEQGHASRGGSLQIRFFPSPLFLCRPDLHSSNYQSVCPHMAITRHQSGLLSLMQKEASMGRLFIVAMQLLRAASPILSKL